MDPLLINMVIGITLRISAYATSAVLRCVMSQTHHQRHARWFRVQLRRDRITIGCRWRLRAVDNRIVRFLRWLGA
jgi:hypothetical protein